MRQTVGSLRSSLWRLGIARLAIQPFLRRREAGESGNGGSEIDRLPFRVEARRLQSVDSGKQVIDEAGDALITVRIWRPIEGDQSRRHRDRGNAFALLDQIGIVARLQYLRKIIILELAFISYWKELEAGLKASAHESVNRLRRDEKDRRHLALAHLLQRDLMGNEGLLHVDAEAAEDHGPRIGGGRALGVEIHFLAGEILQALDLRPNEHVHLRREEIQQVGDAALYLRHLNLVLFERVGTDDRHIDAAQIKQRIQIFRGTAGDDRQDMQVWPVVNDAAHFRGQANRRTLKQAAGEADGPGVHLLLFRLVRRGASRRANIQIGSLRLHDSRQKRQNDRRQCGERERQTPF